MTARPFPHLGEDYAPEADADGFQAALERANAAVVRLKQAYLDEWGPAAVAEMYQALSAARRQCTDRPERFRDLYRLAHDMKGQGGTFGFPLLTEIGESLCSVTAGREDAAEAEFEMLAEHVDAAARVLVERIEEDGSEPGRRLMERLRAAVRRERH